jgi:hypothetical protein
MAALVYVSYDGLLDPLGQSQIVPYLIELAPMFDKAHVLSWEKVPLNASDELYASLPINIVWHRYSFHQGSYFKPVDMIAMVVAIFWALWICKTEDRVVVHCRGHVSALAAWAASAFGCLFKNTKVLFDYRGDSR